MQVDVLLQKVEQVSCSETVCMILSIESCVIGTTSLACRASCNTSMAERHHSRRHELDSVLQKALLLCKSHAGDTFGTTAGDMTSSASSASAAAFARGLRFAAAGAAAVLSEDAAALLVAGFLPAGALNWQNDRVVMWQGQKTATTPGLPGRRTQAGDHSSKY